jgi:hypothetical protein
MKAIANLSVNTKVAKAVADEGGITILTDLAKSMNRLVAEEAAGGLWNLSVGEDHKVVILWMLIHCMYNLLLLGCFFVIIQWLHFRRLLQYLVVSRPW